MRETVKAAITEDELECPNIIVPSVYDKKPVNLISASTESIACTEKTIDVFLKAKQHFSPIKLLYFNKSHDYNKNMHGVYILDYLRKGYCMQF